MRRRSRPAKWKPRIVHTTAQKAEIKEKRRAKAKAARKSRKANR